MFVTFSLVRVVFLGEVIDRKGNVMDVCEELVSRCGYCGDVIDYCQGHGETERTEYGFDYDSDEYEARRDIFEAVDHA